MARLADAADAAQAVWDGDLKSVARVVDQDPDFLRRPIYKGRTAVQLAAMAKRPEVANLLLAGGARLDPYSACLLDRSDELRCALDENPEWVRKRGPGGEFLLSAAASAGSLEVMRLLLERDDDPRVRDDAMVHAQSVEAARLMLEGGADVNAANHNGLTRLHGAAAAGDAEMVAFLLANGADASLRTAGGQTPLAIAAKWSDPARGPGFARTRELLLGPTR